MSKFKIVRKFKLDFLGEEWKDCYLKFQPLTYREIPKLKDFASELEDPSQAVAEAGKMMKLLKEKFIEGRGIGANGKEAKIEQHDLDDLPFELLGKAFGFLVGQQIPNAQRGLS